MLYLNSISKDVFVTNLRYSLLRSINYCRKFVINFLPEEYKIILLTNQSCDTSPKVGEVTFPEEKIDENSAFNPATLESVEEYLYKDGKIPEWIDVYVAYCDDKYSYIVLKCCGRFTDRIDLLYHYRFGYPPFLVRSPTLPNDCKDEDGFIRKFDLNPGWLLEYYVIARMSGIWHFYICISQED